MKAISPVSGASEVMAWEGVPVCGSFMSGFRSSLPLGHTGSRVTGTADWLTTRLGTCTSIFWMR